MRTLPIIAGALALMPAAAQQVDFAKERKATVRHYSFGGDHREESMWSAL